MRIRLPRTKESRDKVLRSMANIGYLSVWEGAVRSSKTVFALCAFALYVVRSPEKDFLLSGRTVGTVEKNCILNEYGLLNLIPGAKYRKVGESRAIVLDTEINGETVRKTIYVVGAADIRAYMAIRGNSYGGWMADEVNMHDPEFVIEALKRTAVSKDRKHLWTLNPDNPRHWIYTDYLDRYDAMSEEENEALGGYRWWHFTPRDNPSMSAKMLKSLEMQFPQGYLYDRYILGKRCIAEGLVYPRDVSDLFEEFWIHEEHDGKRAIDIKYCAIDFGQDHPTVMIFGGPYLGNKQEWRIVKEYYDKKSGRTTADYYKDFVKCCRELKITPSKVIIAIDPAALALRTEFANHGLTVVKAKNDVLPGIAFLRNIMHGRKLRFHDTMVHLREELGTYSWDPKASQRGEDRVIKVNDDAVDAMRYFAYTHMRPFIL